MQSIALYPDLNNIRFPSLDDDTEPENPDLLQLQTEDTYKNYYSNMFSLAEHVLLPPSPTPADNVSDPHEKRYPDLNNIRFPSLDDEVDGFMSLPVSVMPSEVHLPPSPTPTDIVLVSHEKRCPDLKDFDCPSLDEEVAFFMSGPFRAMPWEVPLPPSPTPTDTACDERCFQEDNYPHSSCTCFSSVDEDGPKLMDLNQLAEIPLPPSPTPADTLLNVGHSHEENNQDWEDFEFPSLDDEVACLMSRPVSIPLPSSPSLDDDTEPENPNLLQLQTEDTYKKYYYIVFFFPEEVPLPPSPTPTDTACKERCFQEENYPHSSCTCFSSLDQDVPELMDLNQLAEIPLPPTPTPADTVLDVGHSHEDNNQDQEDFSDFPSPDDEVACLMSRPVSVPLPSSPSLDDNAEPETPDLLQLQTEAYKNYSYTEREWNERCFQENYPHSSCMCFSSLDEDIPELMSLSKLAEIPLPPSPTPA